MASPARYRVVVHLPTGDHDTVIMNAEGQAFHAAVAVLLDARMTGDHGTAGPAHLLHHLADLIAAKPTGSTR
jgi:hypothetical protein